MRQEIRDRLAEKIPLVPSAVSVQHPIPVNPISTDPRCWLTLMTPTGEARIQVPENVAYNFRARYGKAPGFEKWFMDRVRDLLTAS